MDKDLMNISNVETFMDGILRGNVSNNVFFGGFPSNMRKEWSEVLVVDTSNLYDNDAYGRGTILLFVYVPPIGDGVKDVKTFSSIERKINSAIENNHDYNYRIQRRETYTDYDKTNQLFVNIIELTLMIL